LMRETVTLKRGFISKVQATDGHALGM